MKRETIVIAAAIMVSFILLGGYLTKGHTFLSPNHHITIIEKSTLESRCDLLLDGADPVTGAENGFVTREYLHCFFSLTDTAPCYQRYEQEVVNCLISRHKEVMSNDEIKAFITGGIMEEKCQNMEEACTPPKYFEPDEELDLYLKNWCLRKIKAECADLNYEP